MNDHFFFVVREALLVQSSSLNAYIESNLNFEPCWKDDGIYLGSQKLVFVRNKFNMVQKNLNKLDRRFWQLLLKYSSTPLHSIRIDAYVNVKEVELAMHKGVRFCGRDILYHSVMLIPQSIRVPNFIFETYTKGRNYNMAPPLKLAFELEQGESRHLPIIDFSGSKTPLYEFQKRCVSRMLVLEKHGNCFEEVDLKYKLISTNTHEVWISNDDTLHAREGCKTTTLEFNGGFLTDEMGMGKTLTLLTLCQINPIESCDNRMRPKSTLVVCPSHIISHWANEIRKHTNMSYACVTVKDQIQKTTVQQIMSGMYDFVLVSFNLFCNPVFKNKMDYYSCHLRKRSSAFVRDFQKQSFEDRQTEMFVPHIFCWGRMIIDEFHELANPCYPNVGMYISSIKAESKWLVSGTPVVNPILFQTYIPSIIWGEEQCSTVSKNDAILRAISLSNVKNSIYEVSIPPCEETVFKIDLNQSERLIYDGIRTEGRDQQLRVCSYAGLAKCFQEDDVEVETIDEMKELVKKFLFNKAKTLEQEIDRYIERIRQIQPLVPNVEARSREAFTLRQFKINKEQCEKDLEDTKRTIGFVGNTEQTECVICMDEMKYPCTIKTCGHKICDTCLPLAMNHNPICPMCRTSYSTRDVIKVCHAGDNKMLRKYGSKLYNLFNLLITTQRTKTLIFSQWDALLRDVGKCITDFSPDINVLFCRGNIMQKRSTIEKFSNENDHNILLLSTLNAGSGCDLSFAKRVILLDTIDGSGTFVSGIERQAISRCHRIGQTDAVAVVRFIARNTIEEEIYDGLERER